MRRRLSLLLVGVIGLLALCSACGEQQGETAPTVDMEALQQVLLSADPTLPDMLSITGAVSDAKRLFAYVSDLSYDKVENFLLSYSSEGKADEFAVIAVKDPADVQAAAESLRTHLEQRLTLFRQYTPDEAKQAEKALVFTQDQYAVLLISDGNQAVKNAFEEFLAQAA